MTLRNFGVANNQAINPDGGITIDANGTVRVGGIALPGFAIDANGNAISLVDGGGISFLRGPVASGVWITQPSVFRLRLTGTGTATMDAKDSLDNITSAVAVFTASGATDQIEFPYAGDNAVAIRFTLTGSVTVEVI
jgi:hypothetical protein